MELTAAGLLTLGGPMVGAPRGGFRFALISLSLLGCACMLGWLMSKEEGGKEGKDSFLPEVKNRLKGLWLAIGRGPFHPASGSASGSGGRRCFRRCQMYLFPPPPTACIQLDCVIAGVGCAAVGLVGL